MPLVTIIVPVYQVEKYVKECIDSILWQELTDWELLLVDDGSTDASGEICDMYARGDSRIRVFHQENRGVSMARNKGLEEAQGDYILFVDADDCIEKDTLKILVNVACDYQLPIVQFGVDTFVTPSEITSCIDLHTTNVRVYKDLKEYNCFQHGIAGYLLHRDVSLCCRFTLGIRYAEDIEYLTKCITQAGMIGVLSLILYHVRLHESSAMARLNSYLQIVDHLTVIRNLSLYVRKENKKTSFAQRRINALAKSYFSFFICNNLPLAEVKQVNADFRSIYPLLKPSSLKDKVLFRLAYWDIRLYIMLLRLFVNASLNSRK